ncbi:MAG: efflux RND transporter permease subunit [Pseudomonadota bacterium]
MMGDYLRNGRFLALSIVLLIVAGLSALATLPRTEDPRVLNRVALILTPFPGATAERVEALVSEPIESEMRRIPEVKMTSSTSRPGLSVVRVELKDSVTSTEELWSEARDNLADIVPELPAGALEPTMDDDRGYAYTTLVALTWNGPGELDLGVLNRYARELQTRARGVAGTDLVEIYGGVEEEILVEIDPDRLTSLGLSVDDVASALRRADAKVAAGELNNDRSRLQIEVAGELDSLERIRSVPVFVDPLGETVTVGDLAAVDNAFADPPDDIAIIDGARGMVVAIRMLPDLRIDAWTARIETMLAEFEGITSSNIGMETIFDQNGYTNDRLGGLAMNVLVGFLIILAVLFVTLGVRAAVIVALALPLTALFTLACMKYFGLPIHQMSVTGLVVALGIMVDNAIVMVDTIQQRRQEGHRPLRAVVESISHLWLPLLGSTLTTILAFAPIALMPGPAGEFVGGIALSVMFSLVGSYLISHTIIAGLGARFMRPCRAADRTAFGQGIQVEWLSSRFRKVLRRALDRPLTTMAIVLMFPLAGFFAAGQMTEQFFPPSDRDMFTVEVRLPPQTSIRGTEQVIAEIRKRLAGEETLVTQHWFAGRNAPSFYYNMMQRNDGAANFAQGMIKVTDFRAANQLIPVLQRDLDRSFPEAQILVRKLEQGPPFNAPVELRIYGPSLDRLAVLGDELRRIMSEVPDVVHTRATLEDARPKVFLRTREEVARQTGLELTDIASQLEATLDGRVGGSVLEGTEELPVRVRIAADARQTLADLGSTYIAPRASSREVDFSGMPVAALVEADLRPARGAIPRRDGQRVNTIEGYLRADVLPATVLNRTIERLESDGFVLPAGYRLEIGGESSSRDDAVGNLLANVGVIATLLVLVVVLSFNSFRLSGIIFAVAIQAAGLGLLSVFTFGYPFGFTVIIGVLGLIGLAINAAIVILAELKTSRAAVNGDADAIVTGVMSCTRHITSTTITTLGGFMPLILEGGGFWPPFAVTIAGGTVLTTMVSFFFAPAAFRWLATRRAFEAKIEETDVRLFPGTGDGQTDGMDDLELTRRSA